MKLVKKKKIQNDLDDWSDLGIIVQEDEVAIICLNFELVPFRLAVTGDFQAPHTVGE